MLKDRFDILVGILLLICFIAGGGLLLGSGTQAAQTNPAVDKALERDIAYRAKISFLEQLYAPVSELQHAGKYATALLKLDELSRRYPDEAHGELLRGEILLQMQSVPPAIEHLTRAVRMNGDYVDRHSPMSRRASIEQLLEEQLPKLKAKAAQSASAGGQSALKNLYYLQGRLAGGCE